MVYGPNSLIRKMGICVEPALLDSKGELRSRDPGENTSFDQIMRPHHILSDITI